MRVTAHSRLRARPESCRSRMGRGPHREGVPRTCAAHCRAVPETGREMSRRQIEHDGANVLMVMATDDPGSLVSNEVIHEVLRVCGTTSDDRVHIADRGRAHGAVKTREPDAARTTL